MDIKYLYRRLYGPVKKSLKEAYVEFKAAQARGDIKEESQASNPIGKLTLKEAKEIMGLEDPLTEESISKVLIN